MRGFDRSIIVREWGGPLIIFVALVSTALLLSGCNGKAASGYASRKVIRDPDSGAIVYSRDVTTHATQELPPNAAGPTTQSVSEAGTVQSVAGTHARTAEQIVAENQAVLYWIGGGFALAAVVGFALLKSTPLAIGAGIAAAVCFVTPTFLYEVGPWLLPIGAVAVVIGIVWYVANRRASVRSSKLAGETLAAADAADRAGHYSQAVDMMRTAMGVLAVNKPEFARAAGIKAKSAKPGA